MRHFVFALVLVLVTDEIALAKGKTLWDQRETIRRRTVDRETQQEIREHRKKQ